MDQGERNPLIETREEFLRVKFLNADSAKLYKSFLVNYPREEDPIPIYMNSLASTVDVRPRWGTIKTWVNKTKTTSN